MIIFSDLDGTFLNAQKHVSAENRNALDALATRKVPFVPCSGRALSGIAPEIREHPATRYAITSNGAAVIDVRAGMAIRRIDLGFERAAKYYELARGRDVTFDIFADNAIYLSAARYARLGTFIADPPTLASMRAVRTPYEGDTLELLASFSHIERLAMYWRDPRDRDELLAEIGRDADVSCVRSAPTNIEISDAGATKGAALTWLCAYLDIPLSEAVAFGDSINDISMLEAAGTGVAMANAEPETKAAADALTCSNDKDGVGVFISGLLARASPTPHASS